MKTNRRDFLATAGKGILLVSAMPLFNSCGSIIREDLMQTSSNDITNVLGKERMDILYHASLAPSGHNTQPWQVKIVELDKWIIGIDKSRLLPAVDPKNRETILSLGAFIENLHVAALHYGCQSNVTILSTNPLAEELVEIELTKSERVPADLSKIKKRRTARNDYLSRELNSADIDYITGKDDKFIYYSPESKEGKYLTDGTIEANKIQAYRNDAMEELSEWIRWSNKDAENNRDGLTPASMDITGMAGFFVRTFYNKDSVISDSFKATSAEKAEEQANQSGGWITITSNGSSIKELIETGRRFERMLLKVRDKNIAVHPMSQMLEETPFKNNIETELGINGKIQFILRVGYLKSYPEPVSLRRPVKWFTKNIY